MTMKAKFRTLAGGVALIAMTGAGAAAQDFDLSGTEVTIGTAQAQVLNIGTLRMIEMLSEWGLMSRASNCRPFRGLRPSSPTGSMSLRAARTRS